MLRSVVSSAVGIAIAVAAFVPALAASQLADQTITIQTKEGRYQIPRLAGSVTKDIPGRPAGYVDFSFLYSLEQFYRGQFVSLPIAFKFKPSDFFHGTVIFGSPYQLPSAREMLDRAHRREPSAIETHETSGLSMLTPQDKWVDQSYFATSAEGDLYFGCTQQVTQRVNLTCHVYEQWHGIVLDYYFDKVHLNDAVEIDSKLKAMIESFKL